MPYLVPDKVHEPLYAIVPYFNPYRWKSREKHTERAVKHFLDAGAVVYLIEASFNRRTAAFADSGLDGTLVNCPTAIKVNESDWRSKYIHVTTKDELWIKENLVNIAVGRLPWNWQQVCWLDSDIHFARPNWVGQSIHLLQHYAFLQMLSHARDLGPNYEALPEGYPHADGMGFVHAWLTQKLEGKAADVADLSSKNKHHHPHPPHPSHPHPPRPPHYEGLSYPPRVWPGLAWACTRKAWDDVGGLIDIAIWGGGDYHMSWALIERPDKMMRNDLHRNYQKICKQWYHRCRTHIRRNVGVMEGTVLHYWHGRKTDRGYNAKHALLAEVGFDPLRHLKKDFQGVWQLHDDRSTAFVQLRDLMRKVAHERDEDSNDTRLDLWDQGH
jgi:hypothetical protein